MQGCVEFLKEKISAENQGSLAEVGSGTTEDGDT
jgi:hypothetical protein